jgi:hypothetical protein
MPGWTSLVMGAGAAIFSMSRTIVSMAGQSSYLAATAYETLMQGEKAEMCSPIPPTTSPFLPVETKLRGTGDDARSPFLEASRREDFLAEQRGRPWGRTFPNGTAPAPVWEG